MDLHPPLIRRVDFRSRDRGRMVAFYADVLGLRRVQTHGNVSTLGGRDDLELIRVEEDRQASSHRGRTAGLYHIAFLLPSRYSLARAASTLLEKGWLIQGFVDHGVSEALYLDDPDGNGVELTWDKERAAWPLADGKPSMRTRGLSLQELITPYREGQLAVEHQHAGPVIGHAHLTVRYLETAESLFAGQLRLELTRQDFPSALFFTKGDYHHYFAVNQWLGSQASVPPKHSCGWVGLQLTEDLADGEYLSRSDLAC